MNDELGHAAGDAVLVAVTQALRSALRGEDIVGRLGGDEFIVLARGPRSDFEAQRVARNLLEGVAAVCLAEHPHLRISSSIGIVLVPAPALTTSEEVLHAADTAMLVAKRAGKGRWRLYSGSPEGIGGAAAAAPHRSGGSVSSSLSVKS